MRDIYAVVSDFNLPLVCQRAAFVVIYCKTFLCGQLHTDVNSIAPRATLQSRAKIVRARQGFSPILASTADDDKVIKKLRKSTRTVYRHKYLQQEKNDVTMESLLIRSYCSRSSLCRADRIAPIFRRVRNLCAGRANQLS